MEIKVGDYVRLKSGEIDKVFALCGMIENTIHLEKHKWIGQDCIVKYSKNIIDLIEIGDYVNGVRILDITGDYIHTDEWDCCKERLNKKIKSIVTKQQMEAIQYVVE